MKKALLMLALMALSVIGQATELPSANAKVGVDSRGVGTWKVQEVGPGGTPNPTPAPQFTQIPVTAWPTQILTPTPLATPSGGYADKSNLTTLNANIAVMLTAMVTPRIVQPVSSDGTSKVYSNVTPGMTPTIWNQSAPGFVAFGNITPSTGAGWVTNIPYAVEFDGTFTSMTYAAGTFASGNTGASGSAVFLTPSSRCNTTFYNSGTTTAFLVFSSSATAPTDTNVHYKLQLAAGASWTEDQPMPFCHFFTTTPVATGNGNIHVSHKIADTRSGTTYSQ